MVIDSSKQLSRVIIGEASCAVDAWPCCSLPRVLFDCRERRAALSIFSTALEISLRILGNRTMVRITMGAQLVADKLIRRVLKYFVSFE